MLWPARERHPSERPTFEASLPRNTRGGGSEPSTSRGSNPFRIVPFQTDFSFTLLFAALDRAALLFFGFFYFARRETRIRGSATRRYPTKQISSLEESFQHAGNDLSSRSLYQAEISTNLLDQSADTRLPDATPDPDLNDRYHELQETSADYPSANRSLLSLNLPTSRYSR